MQPTGYRMFHAAGADRRPGWDEPLARRARARRHPHGRVPGCVDRTLTVGIASDLPARIGTEEGS